MAAKIQNGVNMQAKQKRFMPPGVCPGRASPNQAEGPNSIPNPRHFSPKWYLIITLSTKFYECDTIINKYTVYR